MQRDFKKYQYHANLLERRRARRYKICRREKPPIQVESDTEYSDGGYSTAEDLKDKECLPHRYKLTRSVDRVPYPTQPRPQPESEVTKPKEVVEVVQAYKKYQYHTNLLERRRARRYKICRRVKPPIQVESDTEYSDGGYSTAEDLKDKECLPYRYKLTRSVDRVPYPTQPRPQPESEVTKPKEVLEVEPINPTAVVPNPRDLDLPDPLDREVNMDQRRLDERARELIVRGEYNNLLEQFNANHRIGQGNGNRDRHYREYDRNERGLRYSIRDIPIFDGKGDAMPHTHLIEFEDFLANTGSDIKDLPQHGEPQEVDRPHYEAVMKDVVNKFKTSLKGKPRLWYEMQYPTSDDEPKTVQAYKKMLSLFTTEHNPIGSTIEQQTMAWKNMKWDPTTERLDDCV